MENLNFSKANYDDIPVILSLAEKVWRKYYPDIISVDQIDYMLDMMYSEDALEKQMDDGHQFYIAYEEEHPLGYLSYSKMQEGNYFLQKFYVDTDQHRKGIGSLFFDEIFSSIKDLKELRLTVNRKNFKAINFYFRKGFTIEHVADFDIGNTFFMNDFILLKNYEL